MPELRLTPVFAARGIEVFVVEACHIGCVESARGGYLTGSLKPVAAVIRTDGETAAFDMDAFSVDPQQFERLFRGTGD